MGAHGEAPDKTRSAVVSAAERWLIAGAIALVVTLLLIEVMGGRSWAWTGFQDNQHLWDWLHLLLLPVVLAMLPVIGRRRPGRLDRRGQVVLVLLGVIVAALVVVGYIAPWTWTGFPDETLWDWLELLLLPVSVGLLPFVLEGGGALRARWVTGFGLFLAIFVLLAVPGYVVPWRWTGVTGNTLWDWIELLVVPFALPVTVTLVLHRAKSSDRS